MAGRPFRGGQSGNPGGRTKAEVAVSRMFPRMISELTDGGRDLVNLLHRIAFGLEPEMKDAKSRAFAIRELNDRLLGKAPLKVELAPVESGPPLDDRDLSDEELAILAKLDRQPATVLQLVAPSPPASPSEAPQDGGVPAEVARDDDATGAG